MATKFMLAALALAMTTLSSPVNPEIPAQFKRGEDCGTETTTTTVVTTVYASTAPATTVCTGTSTVTSTIYASGTTTSTIYTQETTTSYSTIYSSTATITSIGSSVAPSGSLTTSTPYGNTTSPIGPTSPSTSANLTTSFSASPTSIPASISASSSANSSVSASDSSSSGSTIAVSATAVVTGSDATPTVIDDDGGSGKGDTYTFYSGNGTVAEGWPAISDWISFDDMWTANANVMGTSCATAEYPTIIDNSIDENDLIHDAIEAVAAKAQIDHRIILAAIMQESHGCVRVNTTVDADGDFNPGLMQDHNGSGTCNVNNATQINPCPASEITQMIEDGAINTATGPGWAEDIDDAEAWYSVTGAQAVYFAARLYNAGTLNTTSPLGLSAGGYGTQCYVSDIANRLTGWVTADSTCPYAT